MVAAIEDAGLTPDQVDHVNAHGGGSKPGDPAELRLLQLALGDEAAARVAVSATKSMHGHCMGATGALEAAITALALREGVVPPTINLHEVDPACLGVNHVANDGAAAPTCAWRCRPSFGLGGHNSALVLTRAEDGDCADGLGARACPRGRRRRSAWWRSAPSPACWASSRWRSTARPWATRRWRSCWLGILAGPLVARASSGPPDGKA